MTSTPSVRLYTQGGGAASSSQFGGSSVTQTRDPAPSDVQGSFGNYPIGQIWVNTVTDAIFCLGGYSSVGGSVSASWVLLSGGSSGVVTLSGNSGIANPVGSNINVVGSGSISSAASGNTVTFSLTGGDPIDQVNGDAGSATPTAGAISIIGGGGVTTSAAGSTITITGSGGGAGPLSYTPTIGDGTNNFTLTSAHGDYFIIDGVYYVWITVAWSSKGAASGGISISVPSIPNVFRSAATFGYTTGWIITGTPVSVMIAGIPLLFMGIQNNGNFTAAATDANFAASGEIQVSLIYY